MVVKREYSESGSESEDEDLKPVITPKKSKITPTKSNTSFSTSTKSKSKFNTQSESGSPSKNTKVDINAKRTIAEEIILIGIKGLDVDGLARATGLTVQQVRSQIAGGGRANLRKQLMDLAQSL